MTKLTRTGSGPLYAFVRSAWTLLAFQLLAAAIAVGITGWATFQVRPLLEERERLELAIAHAEDRIAQLAEAPVGHPEPLLSAMNRTRDVGNGKSGASATPAVGQLRTFAFQNHSSEAHDVADTVLR